MISLAFLLGLLGLVPAVSGVILMLGARWLSRRVAAIWYGTVLIFSLVVVLFLARLLAYGDTIQATAFAPSGWARWLQLSYQVDAFNIFSALVVGVLATAVAAVLIAVEPAQVGPQQLEEQRAGLQGHVGRQSRIWQAGVLLIALGAVFTLIFANSALWLVLGWGLAGLCAFTLYIQGQTRRHALILLAVPCVSAIILYLAVLPAITTLDDKRLDLLNGLGREPFWAAIIMLATLLAPGAALLIQQAMPAQALPRPAGMSQSAIFVLMTSPATFTSFARLAPLIAGPGVVAPGAGTPGWRAFSLVIVWAVAALALAAALLALRQAERASLPLFLSIQLLSWMFAGIAITGTAALNGALMFKLLRLLALGALLLAGGRKSAQPLLRTSWWLAALALSGLPFAAGFSSAWLITSGAVAAGPAWVAGTGINWLALLLVTLAIVRAGSAEPDASATTPPGAISRADPGPSFLLFLLALLALALGIAPEVAVNFFTGPAASSLPVISSNAAGASVQTNPLGLLSATGAWLPGLFWLLALVLIAFCLLLTQHTRQPAASPPFMGGEAEAGRAGDMIVSSASPAGGGREAEPSIQR
jgi:formate hydrogenlyase subunit 3/multisubunit Na+/H+ antiporter MnhD subunit